MEGLESPLTVLLVEDNPDDARLIRRHLRDRRTAFLPDSIEVHHEETLPAGLDHLAAAQVDLVPLDLGLPGSEGAETFERARERVDDVPVVVLTNLDDERTAVDLLQRGAQDYLSKGRLDAELLVKSIRYALERQDQKRKLRTTGQQLELLNRILRHDVSNDIQVLQAWSERLLDEVAAEHAPEVRKIAETTEHIRELTENSREFVRTVVGEGETETEPVRVDEVLGDELRKARSVHGTATFDVVGEFPAVTVAASGMLASVFRNLLNNAVQHSREDAEVEVALEAGDPVRITVADEGPGVPDARKREIFGKGQYGLESGNTGIGLYLVHTLVTEFGGEVWVEDRERAGDGGAVFVVELPPA